MLCSQHTFLVSLNIGKRFVTKKNMRTEELLHTEEKKNEACILNCKLQGKKGAVYLFHSH